MRRLWEVLTIRLVKGGRMQRFSAGFKRTNGEFLFFWRGRIDRSGRFFLNDRMYLGGLERIRGFWGFAVVFFGGIRD